MLNEMIKTVEKSEKDADELILKAKEEAKQIKSDALEQAENIKSETKAKMRQGLQKAQKEQMITEENKDSKEHEKTLKIIEGLKESAHKNYKNAEREMLECIFK